MKKKFYAVQFGFGSPQNRVIDRTFMRRKDAENHLKMKLLSRTNKQYFNNPRVISFYGN